MKVLHEIYSHAVCDSTYKSNLKIVFTSTNKCIADVVNTGCDTEPFVADEESKRRAAVKSLQEDILTHLLPMPTFSTP